MSNGRCRMHGGASTGPRTPEGLARSRRSRWKHGLYSSEGRAEQKRVRELIRQESRATEAIVIRYPVVPVSPGTRLCTFWMVLNSNRKTESTPPERSRALSQGISPG